MSIDISENLAIERAKKLFNCKYANVQPHSGAQANGAVYLVLLKPGDTTLALSLNSGVILHMELNQLNLSGLMLCIMKWKKIQD